jgi:hypothetical protein
MSLEEVNSFLKANHKREYENARLQCFFNLLAQGSPVKSPSDIVKFEWEQKKKGKRLSKDEFHNKEVRAKKWLDKKR